MSEVLGFGCRLNLAESAVLGGLSADPGLVIVNTCAVTSESVRQARQAVRRMARARPGVRIVVTGCAAEVEPEQFAMPEVSAVIGRRAKFLPSSYGDSPPAPLPTAAARTRAFVPVQTGCDHACTFCIIARARGPSVSTAAAEVVETIAVLVDGGCNEVVLTGVDLTSYADGTLGTLVRRILRSTALKRLRLSSIDSIEADALLLDLFAAEDRLMPQLHLSLQSGDDMILKRMKRRHNRAQAIDFCVRLRARRPGMSFAADLIAGFPTETEAMFAQTAALIDDCGLTQLHVFPFSPRPGTPAARMPQIDPHIARDRAARLRALGEDRTAMALAAQVGRSQRVLVERSGTRGRTEGFLPARVAASPPGSIVTVTGARVADAVLECA